MKNLTDKQRQILQYILEEQANGHNPTYREIMHHFGYSSVATVFQHVKKLESLGYIKREKKARSIKAIQPVLNKLPLLGTVHAGKPVLAVEEIVGFLPFPVDPKAHPNAFLLKVKGDSMIEEHIEEGDLVIVDPDIMARQGDICVAIIGEEATVKKLELIDGLFYLVPRNPKYKPIFVTPETKIIGKVIGLWRSKF